MNHEIESIGQPLDRVDGRLKVTGGARYSADIPVAHVAYGVIITSSIAKGRVVQMDTAEATALPGVLAVLTPFNAPRLAKGSIEAQSAQQAQPTGGGQQSGPPNRKIHLLQEADVFYNGQPIGLAIADTLERAMDAASRVRIRYQEETPTLQMKYELTHAYKPQGMGGRPTPPDSRQGDIDLGWRSAAARVEATYVTPAETHNALEPHGTLAIWEGDHLTLYDATQGIFTVRKRIADLFELPPDNVRILSYFIGGGFGSKGPVWSHVGLAAMGARQVGRPVKLVLTRRQMFGNVGFRGETNQRVRLGARQDGALTLVKHDGIVQTSAYDEFVEPVGANTKMLYACPQIATSHRAVRINSGTPSYTRAPGEASGTFALECAMDELAYRLNMDPVEFRLRNYADTDPENGKPWSSKSLKECYRLGAEKFGWSARSLQPRSLRDGDELVGYGMATAAYPTRRSPASARARMLPDGTAVVQCGTQDIGTGTYTVMTQLAAETLGLPPQRVRCELGDTDLPEGPHSGGSQTAASAGSAVYLACQELRTKLTMMAINDANSPLHGVPASEIRVERSGLYTEGNRGESYAALLRRQGTPEVEARADAKPGEEQQKYSMYAFGAHFSEVRVDPDLGRLRLARHLAVFAAGRILNIKTARNQFMGGVVWGISMALFEETQMDPRNGRIVNADLAEYLVPVHADVPKIEIGFVEEHDPFVNPIGVKGIGEIGIVGAPAAIANAVYHATGRRVRELPITLDKLL
ncbi:MAG TPA: xanthine dehydrogenase family protein molybdopterin-binding subunit [Chthonomonadaceae bacterium]|nr:xanthine dehydrogenase family protein molybdopterin-binding subunit [Chthonomonadaceae bacterium]